MIESKINHAISAEKNHILRAFSTFYFCLCFVLLLISKYSKKSEQSNSNQKVLLEEENNWYQHLFTRQIWEFWSSEWGLQYHLIYYGSDIWLRWKPCAFFQLSESQTVSSEWSEQIWKKYLKDNVIYKKNLVVSK